MSCTKFEMDRRYDLVVFGATGFTGKRVVQLLAEDAGKRLRWAIAGRDASRLETIRKQYALPSTVDILTADVANEESLRAAAAKCTLLLDCVGPFRFFGEPVVKACISAGCHYIDITGEPEFMERMELKFHDEAKAKGVLVVSACGFDSIPADLGAVFAVDTMRKAGFACTSVEEVFSIKSGPRGMAGHFATYESAVHGIASAGALRSLRKQYEQAHPKDKVMAFGARLPRREGAWWFAKEGRWALPFPGSDASVVRRTQRLQVQGIGQERVLKDTPQQMAVPVLPIQFAAYFTVGSYWSVLLFGVYGGLVSFLARWSVGRRLLLAFPRLFTMGMFSHEGPSQEQMDSTSFSMNFYARGYAREKLPVVFATARAPGGGSTSSGTGGGPGSPSEWVAPPKPDAEAVVRVSGPEPGYVATPRILLAAALTILEERASLPEGGVLTPAAAFARSGIIERLNKLGLQFTVVEQPHKIRESS